MAYATLATLTTEYGTDEITRSSDRDNDGVADVGVVDDACARASSFCDSYIGVKYDVPLNPVPQVVVQHAGAIALYYLSADAGTLTDEKRRRYEDAVAWLRDLAAGKATLGLEEPAAPAIARPVRLTADARAWGRSRSEGIL